MKVICEKEKLVEAINIVQKAVSSKNTMQILECILLRVNANDELVLTTTDLEFTIEHTIHAKTFDSGAIAVNSKTFGDIIKKIPDSEIELSIGDNRLLKIESDSTNVNISGLSDDSFPDIEKFTGDNIININQQIFRDMIKHTIFAVGLDETRPIFMGSLIECDGSDLYMVSIDGTRIALRKTEVSEGSPIFKAIIHGKILNEISKILLSNDDEITISMNDKQLMININQTTIVSKLLEGDFFDYKSSIPQTFSTSIIVNTKEFLNSVELASTITISEKKYPIKLTVKNGFLVVSANTEIGNIKNEIEVEMSGDELEIGFNPKYFLDALRVIEEEKTEVCFTSAIGPCIVRSIESDDYKYLILPLRLNNEG